MDLAFSGHLLVVFRKIFLTSLITSQNKVIRFCFFPHPAAAMLSIAFQVVLLRICFEYAKRHTLLQNEIQTLHCEKNPTLISIKYNKLRRVGMEKYKKATACCPFFVIYCKVVDLYLFHGIILRRVPLRCQTYDIAKRPY